MSGPVIESVQWAHITANTNVAASRSGKMFGIFVASASASPTIAVLDGNTSSGTVMVNTFTPVAGTYYPIPGLFQTGLFVTIGGTVDCTVFWEP